MYYVYVLKSDLTGRYYIGSTNDLQRRLAEHNRGQNISTRNRGPWKLMYSEIKESHVEAVKREYLIKSYKGGSAFRKLIG